ncbi:Serine/threonine-protein kinase, active site [Sesbania bispinosa]|nr:Serine/threonine-protein kinase, active site [Sesbania bispinosa]
MKFELYTVPHRHQLHSDAKFVDTGVSRRVSPQIRVILKQQLRYVRSFPSGVRNCYRINVAMAPKYLIRASFYYGNYDDLNQAPQFDLHLGPNIWDTVKFSNASLVLYREIIHTPSQNYIHPCLVNTGTGIPFISAIELRILNDKTYNTDTITGSLALLGRYDIGSITNLEYRYKDDVYDRIWMPMYSKGWTPKSTSYIKSYFRMNIPASSCHEHGGYNQTENSTLPPILNAFEFYMVKDFSQSETQQDDVNAITNIKNAYGVPRNWQGDPCAPVAYIDLSSSGLTGQIASSISKLTMLQYLDLSNNSLSGPVPDFLTQMQSLKVLNLGKNNLTGLVPSGLIDRSKKGSLSLSVEQNPNLCESALCNQETDNQKKKNTIVIPVLASVAGVLVRLAIAAVAIVCGLKKNRPRETNIGLIYEYMANGNLDEHLSGKHSMAKFFTWEDRLRIAVDAAQGLEYLHNGCKPPIIHRDVKTTNILLNENFQAKLADFGLSKTFPTDGWTHLSTVVAGTPGYLDPEYGISSRLTEKSDVYSFGVVLLEIITSQPAISKAPEKIHISQWVSSLLSNGDIKNIVDSRLHEDFDTSSAWKAIELGMASVSINPNRRPNMSDIVTELKECLTAELARKRSGGDTENIDSVELVSLNLETEFCPLAR